MKNLYLWIVATMVCFGILPAAAQDSEVRNFKFTIDIPNADALSCAVNSENHPLTVGVNEFDLPEGTSVMIKAVAPWKIISVKDKAGNTPSGFYGTDWYIFANESIDGEEFTVEVQNIDDLRTSQFTLNVDDPTLVNAILNGYYTTLELTAGENIIKFQPGQETHLLLSSSTPGVPLYSVKMNGVEVAPEGNSYSIPLSNNSVIDVVATLPDEDHIVTFSYSADAENSISIMINDQPATDFNGSSVTVKLGDRLTIIGNTSEYVFESVSINGQEISFYGSYTFNVMKDSSVQINARPYGNISATIIVNAPELITIMGNGQTLDLIQGSNKIELPENNANISWNVSPMAILKSVIVNGTNPISSYQSSYTLNAGDEIEFDIEAKVFDMEAIVWIDNTKGKACSNYLDLSSPNDRNVRIEFENGYNIVDFYEGMNPFSLNWNGYSEEDPNISLTGKVYLNDVLLTPTYEGGTNYNLILANGDVLKLFMDSDPVNCNVTFDIAEGIDASVVKDIITDVLNPTAGFDCFAGTQIVVAGKDIAVSVNGVAIEAEKDEEGVESYTFIVTDPTTAVAVTAAGGSGVASIASEADTAVYNMQGVKVGTKADLNSLAPGLYIVAGKKVVIAE
ncbi:MAG: hypothetical protein K2M16_08085 [Muribaculaceae bacterium]|nr:hypothetical protein [Muribaculaceae bacterium]